MAIVTTDNQHYSDIADAIREKGVSGSFKPSEMAAAIEAIPSGGGYDGQVTLTQGFVNTAQAHTVLLAVQESLGINNFILKKKNPQKTSNEFLCWVYGVSEGGAYRWRDGHMAGVHMNDSRYDCVANIGDTLDIIKVVTE